MFQILLNHSTIIIIFLFRLIDFKHVYITNMHVYIHSSCNKKFVYMHIKMKFTLLCLLYNNHNFSMLIEI